MSYVVVDNLRVDFGDGVVALDGVSLAIERGEFFTVVGPTNAGKSTLLKTIAGLHRPNSGRILISGNDVTQMEPRHRDVSLQFQNIALFPSLTGFDNIAFPLRAAGLAETDIAARVTEVASLLKVNHVLARLPRTFSGGEQQRVAIGRAIAHRAKLLMLDEPLTNLDARIRIALRVEFKALHRDTGQTILYVTHDQVEAMSLSDRIAVIHEGRVQQIGTPDEIYQRPANRFVARFMGQPPMNILPVELADQQGTTLLRGPGCTLPIVAAHDHPMRKASRLLELGVRPEAIRAGPSETPETPIAAEVVWIERLGSKHILDLRLGGTMLKAVVKPDHPVRREGPAWLGIDAQADCLLDRQTGHFLR
jgi:multiple sugar transport system ATP-binding protein